MKDQDQLSQNQLSQNQSPLEAYLKELLTNEDKTNEDKKETEGSIASSSSEDKKETKSFFGITLSSFRKAGSEASKQAADIINECKNSLKFSFIYYCFEKLASDPKISLDETTKTGICALLKSEKKNVSKAFTRNSLISGLSEITYFQNHYKIHDAILKRINVSYHEKDLSIEAYVYVKALLNIGDPRQNDSAKEIKVLQGSSENIKKLALLITEAEANNDNLSHAQHVALNIATAIDATDVITGLNIYPFVEALFLQSNIRRLTRTLSQLSLKHELSEEPGTSGNSKTPSRKGSSDTLLTFLENEEPEEEEKNVEKCIQFLEGLEKNPIARREQIKKHIDEAQQVIANYRKVVESLEELHSEKQSVPETTRKSSVADLIGIHEGKIAEQSKKIEDSNGPEKQSVPEMKHQRSVANLINIHNERIEKQTHIVRHSMDYLKPLDDIEEAEQTHDVEEETTPFGPRGRSAPVRKDQKPSNNLTGASSSQNDEKGISF